MKKIALLLTGSLFLALALHAQKEQPKLLFEWSLGPSFPIGRFASSEYKEDDIPGFAKSGLSTQFSIGHYLNQSIGVMLLLGSAVHPRDKDAYKKDIESSTGITVKQIELKSWKSLKLMAGGFWITPLSAGSELVLRTKLTAGVAKTSLPESDWSGTGQGSTTASGHGDRIPLPWSFCYQVSAALEYKLSPKWHVLLDISSFNTTARKEYNFTGPAGQVIPVKFKVKQATVNVLLGISMRF